MNSTVKTVLGVIGGIFLILIGAFIGPTILGYLLALFFDFIGTEWSTYLAFTVLGFFAGAIFWNHLFSAK